MQSTFGLLCAIPFPERRLMVTLEDARKVIAAAEQKAAEIKQPMNIADEGGNLVSHIRRITCASAGAGVATARTRRSPVLGAYASTRTCHADFSPLIPCGSLCYLKLRATATEDARDMPPFCQL
jgi:Haem-degrading